MTNERDMLTFSDFETLVETDSKSLEKTTFHIGPSTFQGPADWLIGDEVFTNGAVRVVKAVKRFPPEGIEAPRVIQLNERIGLVYEAE